MRFRSRCERIRFAARSRPDKSITSLLNVSIPTFHRTHESHLVWRTADVQCGTPLLMTSSQTRSHAENDRRRTNRTHRVGALPQSHHGLCGTLVDLGKDTHGTPVPLRREAVSGPQQASRDSTKTTRQRFTASRFGHQYCSGAGLLKPQIDQAAPELGDKTCSRLHHRSRKEQTESLHSGFGVEDCRGTASAI